MTSMESYLASEYDPEFDHAVKVIGKIVRPLLVAFYYFVSLLILGFPPWKDALIGFAILTMMALPIGSRVIQIGAVLLVGYAFSVWLGALPDPAAHQNHCQWS